MSARKLCLYGWIAALVLGKGASVVFLLNAAHAPDPASGRTMAYIFAARISPAPSYITTLEAIVLGVCFGAAIACFLLWAWLGMRDWLRARG